MPQKIKNLKEGVQVEITPQNSTKIDKLAKKHRRSFAGEVNVACEDYTKRQVKFKDDGR